MYSDIGGLIWIDQKEFHQFFDSVLFSDQYFVLYTAVLSSRGQVNDVNDKQRLEDQQANIKLPQFLAIGIKYSKSFCNF